MCEPAPAVLIVGAGQVGVVFAHHLARAGARLGLLVKPAHQAAASRGFTLYPLNRPATERHQPVELGPDRYQVLADPASAADTPWDFVLLTLSSAGLRGPWFDALVAACPRARFVTFQLALGDREWIAERLPAARQIEGMLALLSYAAPLAGEPVPRPGSACFFLPGGLPFGGPDEAAVARLVATLVAGGMPARATRAGTGAGSRLPDFVLMALVGALELCDFRFAELRRHPGRARLAIAAARQAAAVDEARGAPPLPWPARLVGPAFLQVGLWTARRLLPLPLEDFLRVHFTKLAPQLRRDRALHLAEAARLGLPASAIERLDAGSVLAPGPAGG